MVDILDGATTGEMGDSLAGVLEDAANNSTALIQLTQLPQIEEHLLALREAWEQKTRDAAAMVCTGDTIQAVKKLRAEMRKEFEEADTQRKAVKAQYMAPWETVEEVFSECVKSAYLRADGTYKAKIDEVEGKLKANCEQRCREYFAELCAVNHIDFLKFEDAGVSITLTEAKKKTPTAIFEQLKAFAKRVSDDLYTLEKNEYPAESIAEYKTNGYRVGLAVKTVVDRHEAEKTAREVLARREELAKREAEAAAQVERALVENYAGVPAVLSIWRMQNKRPNLWENYASAPVVVRADHEQAKLDDNSEPKEEPVLTVTFTATATREKLIRLREFMKTEGIKYE